MRVLIYSYNYYPEPIGIAPLMTELAEGLATRGHEVRVVTGMPNYPQRRIYPDYRGKLYSRESCNGVTIQRSYVWTRPNPSLLDRILLDLSFVCTSIVQALRGPKPDVILMTAPPLPVVLSAALLSRRHHCPIVLNLQDILPDAAIQLGMVRSPLLIRLLRSLERFAYDQASAISIISPKFTANLEAKAVDPQKLCCIPNWIDLSWIGPTNLNKTARQMFRESHNITAPFVALYSGNIAHSQGIETLLWAAVQLKHLFEICIVIVGEEGAIQRLQDWCETVGLVCPNVRFLPLQPRSQLPNLLAAADVGLVLQRRNVTDFNMPSKVQLYMAAALPMVVSARQDSAAADAVGQSGGGLRVEPENATVLAGAIAQLYHSSHRAKAMGRRNRSFAEEHYGFQQALDHYEALFQHPTTNQHNDKFSAKYPDALNSTLRSQ